MARGRTVSANFLTEKDESAMRLCEAIGNALLTLISGDEARKRFKNEFARIAYARDAGAGQGGGKLQRDALCTRGIQGKAPYSNRNLRWHPLVVAQQPIAFAKEIERIEIEGDGDSQTLLFVVKENASEKIYPASRAHEMPERFVALPKHWRPHIERLKFWNDALWTQNSCVIAAYEACDWQDAAESFGVLAISAATNFFRVRFDEARQCVAEVLNAQTVDRAAILPSSKFPTREDDVSRCPLCQSPVSAYPANLAKRKRDERWKPEWLSNKRGEGDDASMQVMHILPLIETEPRHNARNVRYGHRWCNVAMTDHSIEETLDFMESICKAHQRF